MTIFLWYVATAKITIIYEHALASARDLTNTQPVQETSCSYVTSMCASKPE